MVPYFQSLEKSTSSGNVVKSSLAFREVRAESGMEILKGVIWEAILKSCCDILWYGCCETLRCSQLTLNYDGVFEREHEELYRP